MTKWKCENKECRASCVMYTENCAPQRCVNIVIDGICNWQEVKEDGKPNLPKLTAEVFDRPEPEFPEWCQKGKWVCTYDRFKKEWEYFKVNETKKNCISSDNGLEYSFCDLKPAHLRPWTKEEANGKVVKNDCCVGIITYADKFKCIVGTKVITLKELSEEYHEPDGAPCGVLEHLNEKGDWEA